ncbi:hypothetical protein NFI96_004411 [Prochilodus magdalenae]|nr:hypothetical protein NFI96_004411 [Prochilodus magdalenae]
MPLRYRISPQDTSDVNDLYLLFPSQQQEKQEQEEQEKQQQEEQQQEKQEKQEEQEKQERMWDEVDTHCDDQPLHLIRYSGLPCRELITPSLMKIRLSDLQGQYHFQCTLGSSLESSQIIFTLDSVISVISKSRELVVALHPHPNLAQGEVWDIGEKHLCCDNGQRHDLMLLRLRNRNNPQQFPRFPAIQLPQNPCPTPGPFEADQLRVGNTRVVACAAGAPNACPGAGDLHYDLGQCVCVERPHVATNPGDSGGSLIWHGSLHGVLSTVNLYLNPQHISQSHFMNICHPLYRDWIRRVTTL